MLNNLRDSITRDSCDLLYSKKLIKYYIIFIGAYTYYTIIADSRYLLSEIVWFAICKNLCIHISLPKLPANNNMLSLNYP